MTRERLHGSRGDLVRARRLIDALRDDGHEVFVVESAARRGGELAVSAYRSVVRRVLPRRAALVSRDIGRWAHARGHGGRVASVAREQGAQLIVETQVHFAWSGARAAGLTGLPLLLDDCSPLSETVVLGAGLPALARHVFQRQVAAARHVIVSSDTLRGRLAAEGVPPHKLHVVPNGVDVDAYAAVDRAAARRRLGLEGRCVIGFAGSFQPWHRVELLVEAVAALSDAAPVHILLIGDGPERSRVLAEASRRGLEPRLSAVGAVPPLAVPELVAACDVGALPASNDYGHPMKLLEYAAAGLPSVAPDLSPVREVVRHGETGLLFPEHDVRALSQALARLVGDEALRRRLGARARAAAEHDASWRRRARALMDLVD